MHILYLITGSVEKAKDLKDREGVHGPCPLACRAHAALLSDSSCYQLRVKQLPSNTFLVFLSGGH